MTQLEGKELPLEHIAEYDAIAKYYAKHDKLPNLCGVPGAIEYIEDDPESFMLRVKDFKYAIAMSKHNGG